MKRLKLILAALIISAGTFAQTGIGTTTPDASAQLDVSSTSKGFLAPRMTKVQREAISSPAIGLLVYQTDNDPGYYYFNGTFWVKSSLWTFDGETDIYYNSGNVGIGTTNPGSKLQVSDVLVGNSFNPGTNAGSGLSISYDTDVAGITLFDRDGVDGGDDKDGMIFWGDGGDDDLRFTFMAWDGSQMNIDKTPIIIKGGTGNVGIGTTTPSQTLEVNGNEQVNGRSSALSYKVSSSFTDLVNSAPWYGLGQSNLVLPNGDDIPAVQLAGYYGINFQTGLGQMVFTQAGNVGIGTTTPDAPLHVAATVNGFANPNGSNIRYFNYGQALIQETSGDFPTLNTVSVYAAGDIVTSSSFVAASDKRIKTDIKDINGSLGIIKKLRPVEYTKTDEIKYGDRLNYGFIAQEVEEVIPSAVNTGKGEIPVLKQFENVNFEDGAVYTILVKKGDDIKEQKYTTADARPEGEIIVKSKTVNDFKSLSYDMIFTVAVDAIQELQQEVEVLKAQNAALTQKADAIDQLKAQNEVLTRKTDVIDQLKAEVENLKKMISTGDIQLSNNSIKLNTI